jgi:hypothetical protein
MTGTGNAVLIGMRRLPLFVLCMAWWFAPLRGATLEQLSLDELIQKSTAIVRARVVDSHADFRGAEIFTHWKLEVEEQWKGQPAAEVMGPGGTVRGYRQGVPGAPQLTVGKEYMLFLWRSKSGATYLTGWGQGVFELSKDDAGKVLATRAAASETVVEHGTWRPVKDDGIQMQYAELTALISATLRKGASR